MRSDRDYFTLSAALTSQEQDAVPLQLVPPMTARNPPKNRHRIIACFLWTMAQGFSDAAPGALLPTMESHYGISYAVVLIIWIANAIGFIPVSMSFHKVEPIIEASVWFQVSNNVLLVSEYYVRYCSAGYHLPSGLCRLLLWWNRSSNWQYLYKHIFKSIEQAAEIFGYSSWILRHRCYHLPDYCNKCFQGWFQVELFLLYIIGYGDFPFGSHLHCI